MNYQSVIYNHREKFQTALTAKNYSEQTIRTYSSVLTKFLNDYPSPSKVPTDDIISFIASQKSTAYKKQAYGALQNFYKHVMKQPRKFGFIPFPKLEDRLRRIPTHEQILRMIAVARNTKHALILRLLYATGIRISELVGLQWQDVSRKPTIHVQGKGKRDRVLTLSQTTYEALRAYCKEYKLNCSTKSTDYVLGTEKPYSKTSVEVIVRKAARKAGIKIKVTPHLLRHACFQRLYDTGVPLEKIQVIAGHKSFATTRIYARLNPEKVTPHI